MINEQLKKLGFSYKEIEVYLVINKYGASPASAIAKRCNIKRGSIYDILNSLIKKELIISFGEGEHTYFGIDDINKIIYQEKEKLSVANEVVELLKTLKENNDDIDILYYRGKEGYKKIYENILKDSPDELLVWINLDYFQNALDFDYELWWTKQRIKQKVYAKLIMNDSDRAKKYKSEDENSFRDTKIISSNTFKSTCILYDNYIILFDSEKDITGIRIKHSNIYNMFKSIFDSQWEKNK